MAEEQRLTYEQLEKEFAGYVKVIDERDRAPRFERLLWVIGFLAGGVGSLIGLFLSNMVGLSLVTVALLVEVGAFTAALVLLAVRSSKSLTRPFASFAVTADHDYRSYRELVGWLRQFPASSRTKRLRYLNDRREVISQRLGLFTGGMERMGLLPLIAVLYLQFKDWKFGDWHVLSEVNMLGGLLLWMLLLGYLAGWAVVRLKSRLDAYAAALKESLLEP